MPRLRIPLLSAISILLLLCGCVAWHSFLNTTPLLEVVFLDVGQGDSIFIESPVGTQVLIDGGRGGEVLRALGRVMGFFDHDIDMIIATHPDADHSGGLIDVLKRYTVHTIVLTENESDAPAYASFKRAVEDEGATIIYAREGQVYDLGVGPAGTTTLSILFPVYNPAKLESNVSSIVAQLAYGQSTYLLTGDSPTSIESYLVTRDGARLQSDILKLGHHGSDTATSGLFLDAVHPALGIISAGKDNPYGHPSPSVVARLATRGIPYKNTAESGSIISVTDGVGIWIK